MDTVWSGCLQSVTKGLAAKDTMSTWSKLLSTSDPRAIFQNYWCEWWPRHKLSTWKHFHFPWCATSTSTEFSTLTLWFFWMVRTAVYSISQPHLVNWGGVLAVIMWSNPYGRVLFTSDPGVVWWWYSEAFSSTEVANICTNQYTNVGYEWNELDCYWIWNEIRTTSHLSWVMVI